MGAEDIALPDGFSFHGAMVAGTARRSKSPDSALLFNPNSSLLGITGTAVGGRNQDDGNLNYSKGDAVSTVLKAYFTLRYKVGTRGAIASVKGWMDTAQANRNVPWGNVPNGLVGGSGLSDAGGSTRSQFSGVVIDNLNLYGKEPTANGAVDWVVGYQKIEWGHRYTVFGGLQDIMPRDLPAATRPGVLREEETRIAIPALFAKWAVGKSTSLEGFFQTQFQRNSPNACGTFYSQVDFVAEGCDKATLGAASDRTAIAAGAYIKRAETVNASSGGEYGVALHHLVESIGTDFGIYATRFHSRAAYYSAIKGLRTGAPFVPGDPGGLNPRYFTEFPEGIRMFGLTFDKKIAGGAIYGEWTYRPNQPYQYNSTDLLNGFASLTAPTPIRSAATATTAGAVFQGFERHKAMQVQFGAAMQMPGFLGAAAMTYGGEFVYKRVPDLPDPMVMRFRRPDVFGSAPLAGATCSAPALPTQCSTEGYISKDSYGFRLRAGLRYPNVLPEVDLIPSLFYGQDLKGWAEDGAIIEGRKLAIVALRAVYRKAFYAELGWQPTWGGTYNNMRDRSTVQANIGVRF